MNAARRTLAALRAVMQRLSSADRALRAQLAGEQREQQAARGVLQAREDELAHAEDRLAALGARIDALVSAARPLRVDELLGWEAQRGDALAGRERQRTALANAHDALARIDAKIQRTRAEILRNDLRRKQCDARVAQWRAQAGRDEAEREDDEAGESFGARRPAGRPAMEEETR